MAPKVGVAGVAPEVGEKAPLCTPLCTLLMQVSSGDSVSLELIVKTELFTLDTTKGNSTNSTVEGM